MKEKPVTLLAEDRIQAIEKLVQQVNSLPGNMAEVGSYRGGTAYYINKYSKGKKVYLFDTFTGIPMQGELDPHAVGDFGDTSYEEVKNYFSDSPNVVVTKGLFPDIAKGVIADDEKFCFVHLDVDQYESNKLSIEYFYDKVVPGGVIVFDDYGWLKGIDQSVNEFMADKPEKIVSIAWNQCHIVKAGPVKKPWWKLF